MIERDPLMYLRDLRSLISILRTSEEGWENRAADALISIARSLKIENQDCFCVSPPGFTYHFPVQEDLWSRFANAHRGLRPDTNKIIELTKTWAPKDLNTRIILLTYASVPVLLKLGDVHRRRFAGLLEQHVAMVSLGSETYRKLEGMALDREKANRFRDLISLLHDHKGLDAFWLADVDDALKGLLGEESWKAFHRNFLRSSEWK